MKSANMKEIYIEISLTLSLLLRGWKLNKNLLIYLFKLIFSGATVGTALTCPPMKKGFAASRFQERQVAPQTTPASLSMKVLGVKDNWLNIFVLEA